MSCFTTGSPVRNTELITHHQPEEFGKLQEETPHVQPPPRILLAGIHLGWTGRAPPGWTLSPNDWVKTTQKLVPSPWNLRLWATCRAALLGSLTLLLSARVPFPNKISCFVSTYVSLDNSSQRIQEPNSRPWKGSPFLHQRDNCDFRIDLNVFLAQFLLFNKSSMQTILFYL